MRCVRSSRRRTWIRGASSAPSRDDTAVDLRCKPSGNPWAYALCPVTSSVIDCRLLGFCVTEVDARLVEALAGPEPEEDGSVATLAIDNGTGPPCDDKVFRRMFGDLRVAIASADAVGSMNLLNEDSNVLAGCADEKTASERLGSAGSSVRAEGWVAARTGLSPFPTSGALPFPLALLLAPLRVVERDVVATDALVLVDPVGTSTFPLPLPFAKDGVVADKSGMIVGSSPGDGESVLLHAGKKSVSDAARCEPSSSKKLNDGRAAAPEGGEPNMAAPPEGEIEIDLRVCRVKTVSVQ